MNKLVTTKKDYEDYLNEVGVPYFDQKTNGGRIPDHCNYGTWLRKNDPIAFRVGFREFTGQR